LVHRARRHHAIFHARYAGHAASIGLNKWRGVLEALRDPTYFAMARVDPESETIAWPNGVDLAPEPLYHEARRNPVEPASSAR
jgi:hypothetical protein